MLYHLDAYQTRPLWRTDTLSGYFADNFRDFTVEYFKMIDPDARRELRDLLRNRGVYAPKGRNMLIPDGLYAYVQEYIPWPTNYDEQSTI